MVEKLNQLKTSRKSKLALITRRKNELIKLMENVCNVELVKSKELNESVKALLSAEDAEKEQKEWYKPKMTAFSECVEEATKWIKGQSEIDADECNDDVTPQDSVSNIKSVRSQKSTRSGRSSKSSVLSARLKLESKRVELMVRAAGLERRQELEKEEALLKARKENLDLETEIAANAAKLNIINEYEDSYMAQPQAMDMMNEYLDRGLAENTFDEGASDVYAQAALLVNTDSDAPPLKVELQKELEKIENPNLQVHVEQRVSTVCRKTTKFKSHEEIVNADKRPMQDITPPIPQPQKDMRAGAYLKAAHIIQHIPCDPINPQAKQIFNQGHMDLSNLANIMQKQNMITEALVKQQSLSLLPPLSIPVFKGDPLDYQFFIRAFEHGIEDRTENSKDRLYFPEQFTTGQPRELWKTLKL
ncbi:hypothetical protein N1851_002391 [Merluccius polli]|uniref:Uncharacterized protein n=1 Tax=Merluccius polli TaxID=89951 RepID=A0AA47PD28_MERPO|nr:hypothetical protein N1851_002391 [Merluccius polli]